LLTNMQKIWLSGNSITGRVPTEIGHLKKLEVLEVYDNGLQGRMPIPVCNLVVPSSNGGNLTALVADCKVLNCTCCTSCKWKWWRESYGHLRLGGRKEHCSYGFI
jgi:hypothetical protein